MDNPENYQITLENLEEQFRKLDYTKWENIQYRLTRIYNTIRKNFYQLFPQKQRLFIQNWGWMFYTIFIIILISVLYYTDLKLTFNY
jgi:hypothetical protein|tara:strand:- start:352 stop:612 length:261 start_codon:yes stop_codon:yes gene_type:complete